MSSFKSSVTLGNLGGGGCSTSSPAPAPAPVTPAAPFTPVAPVAHAAPAPAPAACPPALPTHMQQQYVNAPQQVHSGQQQQPQSINLPPNLLANYRRKFDALDLNKDGMITLREFAAVGMVFGYRLSIEELKEIFGRKDLDMSGTITFDEFAVALQQRIERNRRLAPLKQKFSEFDVRGKGYVTADEAYPILRRELGFDMNKTETMVDQYDKNRDYRLSLFEFEAFYDKYEELKVEMHKAFQQFDVNGDGYVDLAELTAGLVPRGFTQGQIASILRDCDQDRDGRLSYPEFVCFWDLPIF